MTQDFFKEILPNILQEKTTNLEDEKDYVPFIVNKALSGYIDTVLYAQQMNMNANLDKRMQYDYLFYSVRKKKRMFQPWMKNVINPEVQAIQEYFHCSLSKAKETLNILTKEQVKEIVNKIESKESGVK